MGDRRWAHLPSPISHLLSPISYLLYPFFLVLVLFRGARTAGAVGSFCFFAAALACAT